MSNTATIYIPTYNSGKTLLNAMESLKDNEYSDYQLLIVDGGSTDNTMTIARSFGATIIQNPFKHVAAARRIASEMSSCDILISLDSDCQAYPGWIDDIMSHFNDKELAGVGGPYICPNTSNYIEEFSGAVFERIMQFPTVKMQLSNISMHGTFVEGNAAFRRSTLIEVGNYRDIFTNHAEGVDMFWRLVKNKYKLVFDPNLKVLHHGYPKNILQMINRNYHFGWSSTKLAKFTLDIRRIDWELYRKLFHHVLKIATLSSLQAKEDYLTIIQLLAFISGKGISSLLLRHLNI